ncbi:Disulfide isomerase L-2 isoform 1 [Hibiscus syriacus]|uniref:Disulfide isomerase L-2 isoform 1 n=1 Tax=Hibiscus syriacus TaxID=106335 RepID=A0A6A2ZMD9_HIBSY|nr:classical arabinogalactan protein 2-like [Hibiscus syriacus]KAE8692923.1 Disulfide isomerase L-2 isoform 1 [Hibiscus syriacus]
MAKLGFFRTLVLFFLVELTFAAYSPAPTPSLGEDSSPLLAPTPVNGSPDSAPSISPVMAASPPAPSASDMAPGTSPASSPAPSPYDASDIDHGNINAKGSEEKAGGGGGMSGGKKAGVVIAVVGTACLVGFGGLVYKKRQDNIRRAQYGYAARREIM